MAEITIQDCRGMSEKVDPKKLPDGMAQEAYNIEFGHGHIKPFKRPDLASVTPNLNSIIGTTERIYLTQGGKWLAFDDFVSIMDSPVPDDSFERVYTTGEVASGVALAPRVRDGQSDSNLSTPYQLGVPKPANPPSVSLDPVTSANADSETPISRAYAITYVTNFGEEGPPSTVTATNIIDVYSDQTVTVEAGAAPSGRNIQTIRVYRTDEDGVFRVLTDISSAGNSGSGFTDSTADTALGEEVPSTDWDEPPADLQGIMHAGNGIIAGFSGKTLYFSERYLPHAWPEQYQLTTNYNIVALANLPDGILVLTEGKPSIATGNDPAGMTLAELDFPQSCISARGVAEMGDSVIYPSPDGMMQLSSSGGRNLTEMVFSRDQWSQYAFTAQDELQGFFWEGQYIGFGKTSETVNGFLRSTGFVIDPRGQSPSFSWLEGTYDDGTNDGREWGRIAAGFSDLKSDTLYLVSNTDTTEVYKWAESTDLMEAKIVSSVFYSPRPVNFGAVKINAEGAGGAAGAITLYGMGRTGWASIRATSFDTADNTLGMGHESDAEQIERLPSGSKHNEVYIEVRIDRADSSSRTGVSMVKYVESMAEL
jgi:hypothetical protein